MKKYSVNSLLRLYQIDLLKQYKRQFDYKIAKKQKLELSKR